MEEKRFLEKNAQVLGISIDNVAVQKAFCASFGGVNYPVLSDFHPHGKVTQLYGIYNEERGTSRRAIFVVDKQGIVRFKRVYLTGLPDPAEVLKEVESLA